MKKRESTLKAQQERWRIEKEAQLTKSILAGRKKKKKWPPTAFITSMGLAYPDKQQGLCKHWIIDYGEID